MFAETLAGFIKGICLSWANSI